LRASRKPVTVRVLTENSSVRLERHCESPQQREADLRELQGGEAERRDAHHLQAKSQAQAAAGLTWLVLLVSISLATRR
jgi:hypothetical protein